MESDETQTKHQSLRTYSNGLMTSPASSQGPLSVPMFRAHRNTLTLPNAQCVFMLLWACEFLRVRREHISLQVKLHGLLGGKALALPAVPTGVLYVVHHGGPPYLPLPSPSSQRALASAGVTTCLLKGIKWPTGTWRGLKQHDFICPVARLPFPGWAGLASIWSDSC